MKSPSRRAIPRTNKSVPHCEPVQDERLDVNAIRHATQLPRLSQLAGMVLGFACCVGCGQTEMPTVPVEGTVQLDGRPLENVLVRFLPDTVDGETCPGSAGVTDAQGHFRLRCEDQRDGAVVGRHRVVLEDMAVYAMPRKENAPPPAKSVKSRVPPHYGSAANTPLCVDIEREQSPVRIDLSAGR